MFLRLPCPCLLYIVMQLRLMCVRQAIVPLTIFASTSSFYDQKSAMVTTTLKIVLKLTVR